MCNSIISRGYFPAQRKVAQTILIPKPDKPPEEIGSNTPISLPTILSKIFEEAIFKRLCAILEETRILPGHQFGFRHQHSAIQQAHRITEVIRGILEQKHRFVAFLDITSDYCSKLYNPFPLHTTDP
jgi:hypothetical protein